MFLRYLRCGPQEKVHADVVPVWNALCTCDIFSPHRLSLNIVSELNFFLRGEDFMFSRWRPTIRRLLLLIAIMQVSLVPCVPAQTQDATADPAAAAFSQPIPNTYFGVNLENIGNYPWVYVGSLGKASAAYWPFIERSKGVYDWSRLDAWANKAKAEGAPFFFSNDYVPEWAAADKSSCLPAVMNATVCTSTVANIQDWDDFVTALVTRYNGKIEMYELWNEPDQKYFTGTVQQMVTLTNHMYNIVRKYNPHALIAAPSAGNTAWLDSYWAAGGVKTVDLVTTHDYPDPRNPVAEVICAFRTLPLKAVMVKYGIQKPIWDTEGSWGGANTLSSDDLQAAFVARHLILHWACGVQRFYWYAWDGADLYPYWGNLWSSVTRTSPAGYAFMNVEKWLRGAVMPNSCLVNGGKIPAPPSLFHGVYTCNLTRAGGYQAQAVWNTDGASTYIAPTQFTKYRDVAGHVYALPASHEIGIGHKPILLEN